MSLLFILLIIITIIVIIAIIAIFIIIIIIIFVVVNYLMANSNAFLSYCRSSMIIISQRIKWWSMKVSMFAKILQAYDLGFVLIAYVHSTSAPCCLDSDALVRQPISWCTNRTQTQNFHSILTLDTIRTYETCWAPYGPYVLDIWCKKIFLWNSFFTLAYQGSLQWVKRTTWSHGQRSKGCRFLSI